MKYFDAHCHLQLSHFDIDRDETIARMEEADCGGIVVGTDFKMSREAVELAEQYEFLHAAVGLHPNDNVDEEFDVALYEELAADPKVVAIGECGLDYFKSGSTEEEREVQQERFEKQVELAIKVQKPLIIHCRNNPKREDGSPSAHADLQQILTTYKKDLEKEEVDVVIHFFTGSGELAQQYLDMGCYLSFPGPITYTDMYDEAIKLAPLDKILSETDSPFAAPVPHRGKRNEPVFVEEVVKKIAEVKGLEVEEVAAQIIKNAQHVFGLGPHIA